MPTARGVARPAAHAVADELDDGGRHLVALVGGRQHVRRERGDVAQAVAAAELAHEPAGSGTPTAASRRGASARSAAPQPMSASCTAESASRPRPWALPLRGREAEAEHLPSAPRAPIAAPVPHIIGPPPGPRGRAADRADGVVDDRHRHAGQRRARRPRGAARSPPPSPPRPCSGRRRAARSRRDAGGAPAPRRRRGRSRRRRPAGSARCRGRSGRHGPGREQLAAGRRDDREGLRVAAVDADDGITRAAARAGSARCASASSS